MLTIRLTESALSVRKINLIVNKWYLTNEHFPDILCNKYVKYRNTIFVLHCAFSQSLSGPNKSLFTWKITFYVSIGVSCARTFRIHIQIHGSWEVSSQVISFSHGRVCKQDSWSSPAETVHRACQPFLPNNKPFCLMQL